MLKTVLIVEDDEHLRSIYSAALSARGFHVLTATQGAEGVHLARKHRPNLILLDLRMPVMDGRGAAWYLRSDPATRTIPLCAISAYPLSADESDSPEGIAFDHFLIKPVDPKELVANVEAMIGPAR